MSDDSRGQPAMKNSLLSAASSSFSFEDSALLVPVLLHDEPTPIAEQIQEIDLNSDELEEQDGSAILQGYSPSQKSDFLTSFSQRPNISTNEQGHGLATSSTPTFKPLAVEPVVASEVSTSITSIPLFSLFSTQSPKLTTTSHSGNELDWSNLSHPTTPFISPPPPPMTTTTTRGLTQTSVHSAPSNIFTPSYVPHPFDDVPDLEEPITLGQSRALPPMSSNAPPVSSVGPPTSARGNNFRMGNQRPMYAKYPGLSGSSHSGPPLMPIESPSGPIFAPPPLMSNEPPVVQGNQGLFSAPPLNMFTSPTMETFGTIAMSPTYVVDSGISEAPFCATSAGNTFSNPPQTAMFQPSYSNPAVALAFYKPLTFHWFHRKDVEGRPVWRPFSTTDSAALERQFIENKSELIASDGGRFDVDVHKRLKYPVYWEEDPSEVRRCSWFYKGPMDSRFVPYEENLAERLEAEYYEGVATGVWNRRLEFPGGEAIILYNPSAISHFCQAAAPDEWGNLPESQLRPRVVKRSVEEFEIEEGESTQIDHLVFLVHGIGAICDFKFRTIVEAVDDFRHLSFQLMQTHFKEAVDSQRAGRVEFLPVSWHKALHGEGGIDQKLKPITLKSIPKLRNFTNDTLLDILFYTSPVYAQTIVDTVGSELNRLYNLFLSRNPNFNGYVALSGHSLGSLILFDLLAHQPQTGKETTSTESGSDSQPTFDNLETASVESDFSNSSKMVSYTIGSGTGRPLIKYPTLQFKPTAFFALGSPIAMFVTVRGCDSLGENFHFPTCPAFFNIFHPFDPVAYRIETLIDANFNMRPVIIPHHKGRKRFHLELKETMQRVGADIKQKFLDSLKTTWNTVYQYATFSKGDTLEKEIDRVLAGEFGSKSADTNSNGSGEDLDQEDIGMGKLNGGRRIDYVLQEAPLESFNEYLFALSSHVCYWESEDTMLMVMREIYASMGIFVEQQSQSEQQFSNNLPATPVLRDNNGSPYQINQYVTSPIAPPPSSSNFNRFPAQQTPLFGNPQGLPNSSSITHNAPPPPLFMNSTSMTSASQATPSSLQFMSSMPSNIYGKPTVIGARPVISPEDLSSLRGMDPTQPIISATTPIGPPPLTGFQRKK